MGQADGIIKELHLVDQETAREAAVKRLKGKRDFRMHLGAYVIVNAMLVSIWALTARGNFWPIWVLLFWGVGLALNGWSAYFQKPFSEDDIRREMGGDQ